MVLLGFWLWCSQMLTKPIKVIMASPSWTISQLMGPTRGLYLFVCYSLIVDFLLKQKKLVVCSSFWLSDPLTGKEGPVHDVQWSYCGSEFAVVYGCILLLNICLYVLVYVLLRIYNLIQVFAKDYNLENVVCLGQRNHSW